LREALFRADESIRLAPIDPVTLQVHAYPRAVSLKRDPPPRYALPPETLVTPHSLHVPAHLFRTGTGEYPLAAVFFVTYCDSNRAPRLRAISTSETAARLYANALNQLAHPNAGLDAAARIAKSVPGYLLETADLAATCDLIMRHEP
jgi:hypothetical protein